MIGFPDLPPSHGSRTLVLPAGFVSQGTQSRREGHVLPVSGHEITLAEASNGAEVPLAWFDELHATECDRSVPRRDSPRHFPD